MTMNMNANHTLNDLMSMDADSISGPARADPRDQRIADLERVITEAREQCGALASETLTGAIAHIIEYGEDLKTALVATNARADAEKKRADEAERRRV